VSELVGLQEIHDQIDRAGVRLIALSVDQPEQSRGVVEGRGLSFPILADVDRTVTAAYGLLHKGGGPGGSDIAIPAHLLIDRDGGIVWRHVARRIQDRPDPQQDLDAVRRLSAPGRV